MTLVYIVTEDGRQVLQTQDAGEAVAAFASSAQKVEEMNGDIEASLTVAWIR